MLIINLIIIVTCGWWDFNEPGLHEQILSNRMIFILCDSRKELVAEYKKYSSDFNSSYIFTYINCRNTSFSIDCFSIACITNENRRYWEITEASKYREFITERTAPQVTQINGFPDVSYIEEGTFFHLTLTINQKKVLETFLNTSSYFRVYGARFSYSFEKIKAPEISSFYSTFCMEERRIRPYEMHKFIMNRVFSSFHRYDREELINSKGPMLLLVNDKFTPEMKESINMLSQKYCEQAHFGWIYSNETIFQSFAQIPRILATHRNLDCILTSNNDFNSADNYKLVDQIIKGNENFDRMSKLLRIPRRRTKSRNIDIVLAVIVIIVFFICLYFFFLRHFLSLYHLQKEDAPKKRIDNKED